MNKENNKYKLNLFDLFLLLVVFSLLPLFYYSYKLYDIRSKDKIIQDLQKQNVLLTGQIANWREKEPREKERKKIIKFLKIKCIVPPYISTIIKNGDFEIEKDSSSTTSKIISIKQKKIWLGYNYDIVALVEVKAFDDNGYLFKADQEGAPLKIGLSFKLKTRLYNLEGTILDIRNSARELTSSDETL